MHTMNDTRTSHNKQNSGSTCQVAVSTCSLFDVRTVSQIQSGLALIRSLHRLHSVRSGKR